MKLVDVVEILKEIHRKTNEALVADDEASVNRILKDIRELASKTYPKIQKRGK